MIDVVDDDTPGLIGGIETVDEGQIAGIGHLFDDGDRDGIGSAVPVAVEAVADDEEGHELQ